MAFSLILLGLLGATACTAGAEYEPPLCPTGLPAVRSVRIDRQGASRWKADGEPPCGSFRLNDAEVRKFFRAALRAEARQAHFTLSESACVVFGRVHFVDSSEGAWLIDRFAGGWLDRPGRPRMTLYCRTCQFVEAKPDQRPPHRR